MVITPDVVLLAADRVITLIEKSNPRATAEVKVKFGDGFGALPKGIDVSTTRRFPRPYNRSWKAYHSKWRFRLVDVELWCRWWGCSIPTQKGRYILGGNVFQEKCYIRAWQHVVLTIHILNAGLFEDFSEPMAGVDLGVVVERSNVSKTVLSQALAIRADGASLLNKEDWQPDSPTLGGAAP